LPKTLLAVDDSATMRKVLEITFAGDEFRVVAVDSASNALGRMSEDPSVAVIDTALGGDDGYALAKEMRSRSGRLAVVLLSSRYNPYDPNRGREAGVDDFIDKPFDTQMLIDKVKKAVATRELSRPTTAQPPAPPPMPPAAFATTASFGSTSRAPAMPGAAAAPPAKPAWSAQRTHTLSFEGALPIVPAPVVMAPAPAPLRQVVAPPAAPPAPPAPPAAAMAASPAYSPPSAPPKAEPTTLSPAANGHLGKKLGELGLTPAQADAVLALSRELIERVVWEVVPQIAETLIKEEITRLTKES
jgi:CheY-like chemotaxis protein